MDLTCKKLPLQALEFLDGVRVASLPLRASISQVSGNLPRDSIIYLADVIHMEITKLMESYVAYMAISHMLHVGNLSSYISPWM